jgi:hypothetical protein
MPLEENYRKSTPRSTFAPLCDRTFLNIISISG